MVGQDTAVRPAANAQANLEALIARLRIEAIPEVYVSQGSFDQILRQYSSSSDIVFLGMAPPGEDFQHYYQVLQNRMADLPSSVMVLAAPNFAFTNILTE